MRALFAGLLFLTLAAPHSLGQDAVPPDVAFRIEEDLAAGDHQAAMAVAHEVASDPDRFALEADILFHARSYRASLGRAREALAGGIHTPLLLARGVGSAIWLGEGESALEFWPAFESAIAGLPVENRSGWADYAATLRTQIDELVQRQDDVTSHVARARRVSLGLLGAAVLGLSILLLRTRGSE